mgnify:FL=1
MEYVFLSNIIRKYIKGKSPDNNVFLFSKNDVEVSYLTPEYLRGIGSPIQVKNQKSFVWVEDGDIIILWDGSNAGEILKGKNGVLPSTMVKLLIFNDYYKEYVFYLLKFNEYKFKGKTQGSGIPHANKDEIERVKIYKIDFNEQSKIAEILMTIDDAIEKTERIIAKYRHIKQGLLQDLLTKGIDENGNIRSEATHKFKDSPLGRIPVEWEVVNVNDIAIHVGSGSTPRGGQSVYLKEGILFIRSQNVSFDGLLLDDVAYIDDETHKRMKRSIVKNGDVLLNITGASLGRVCVYKELNEANVNQHVCIIRVKDKNEYNSDFLNAYLASYYGQCQIEKLIAGGNREGLNFSHIRTIKVPYFKYDEQERIVKVLETVDLSIRSYFKELNKQIAIKQGLMQDLLSGKVRVTHLLDKGGKSDECHP